MTEAITSEFNWKYPPDANMTTVDLDAEIEGVTGTWISGAWPDLKTGTTIVKSYFAHFRCFENSKNLPGIAQGPETNKAFDRYWREVHRRDAR